MKKAALFLIAAAVLTAAPQAYSYPQSGEGSEADQQQMQQMYQAQMAHQAKMMNAMMIRPLGVTEEGDVYLLSGTTIQKYDSNLNLVKEQEVKSDYFGMQDMPMDAAQQTGAGNKKS